MLKSDEVGAKTLACPRCSAAPGKSCLNRSVRAGGRQFFPVRPHAERIAAYRAELDRQADEALARAEAPGHRVLLVRYRDGYPVHEVASDDPRQSVRFKVGDTSDDVFMIRIEPDGSLDVSCHSPFSIEPRASNAAVLRISRRY